MTLILAGVYARQSLVTPLKRARNDRPITGEIRLMRTKACEKLLEQIQFMLGICQSR